jgi:hypothetical protein
MSCCFCNELESVDHLFFDCCVAQVFWNGISEVIGLPVGYDFESVAKLSLSEKKFKTINVCTSAVHWTIWKMRNEIGFLGLRWTRTWELLSAGMLDWWRLHRAEDAVHLERLPIKLERSLLPPRLT